MGILDELKSVAKVLQETGKIEQYQQIIDAQAAILEMQGKIFELERQNRELHDELNTRHNLVFKRNVYWLENGKESDGPFCTKCYDVGGDLVRMRQGNYLSRKWALCPSCKESV